VTSAWQGRHRPIPTNGITLSTWVGGRGPLVVLCHGFPELGYSWRHQAPALVERGYRVAVPDMRGYGHSSRPDRVQAYDIEQLAADVVGLVGALGEQDAVLVGHDWGASVTWHAALAHPDCVTAVAGLSVPAVRRPPVAPMSIIRRRFGDDHYLAWFQDVGPADTALMQDVRRTLTASSELTAEWVAGQDQPDRPAWLTEADLAYYVEAFSQSTFTPGLNYYRNIDRNWELTVGLSERRIQQPALFVRGAEDLVASVMSTDSLKDVCADLRAVVEVPGAGHWLQQESPHAVNEALLGFLGDL